MSAFGVRSRGYQAGILLLYIASSLFIIGIVSPMWLVWNREIPQIREENFYAGVMVGCKYNLRLVGASSFDYTRCSFGFATAFDRMEQMGMAPHTSVPSSDCSISMSALSLFRPLPEKTTFCPNFYLSP